MRQNEIKIKFNHVLHESELPNKDRQEFSKIINKILQPIKNEIIFFKGTVEVIESKNGNFSFKSECKNAQIQDKMNELISHSMPKLKND